MKTEKEIEEIINKIKNNMPITINEMCEGFSIIDGKVTDELFWDTNVNEFDEDDELAFKAMNLL
jgi:hypothetical protein